MHFPNSLPVAIEERLSNFSIPFLSYFILFSFYILPLFCIMSSAWWPSLASQTCSTLMVRHKKRRRAVATLRRQTPFSPRGCIPSLISKLSITVAWECVLGFGNYLKIIRVLCTAVAFSHCLPFFLPPIIPSLSTFVSNRHSLLSLCTFCFEASHNSSFARGYLFLYVPTILVARR